MRVSSTATSLSWIPSEAVTGVMKGTFSTGLSHYDQPPPGRLDDLAALRDADGFRFANRLQAWAEFDADGRVTGHGRSGGVLMGSTTVRIGALGATFAAVPMPDLTPEPEVGDGWVRFSQTCGGRTALPLPRPVRRPPFVRLQAPLVWTTLALTLRADGSSEVELTGASPFPRHWVYDAAGELVLKAGVADWSTWLGQPSWRRTPWGEEDSPVLVTAAESALERELSGLLMHGAVPPTVREAGTGTDVLRQGDPGDSVLLVLDGVVEVVVDGEPLGQLGPGAVLGERAVLEGGSRTATVRAVTRVRVAEAPGSTLDLDALAALAQGHRREDGRTGHEVGAGS